MRDSGEHAGCARVVSLSNPILRHTPAPKTTNPHTQSLALWGATGVLVKRKRVRACTVGCPVGVAGLEGLPLYYGAAFARPLLTLAVCSLRLYLVFVYLAKTWHTGAGNY